MLLVVARDGREAETLRRDFAKLHLFAYFATYQNFLHSAEKYAPNAIVLKADEVTDALVEKVNCVKAMLPDVPLITLSDADVSSLSPDIRYGTRVHAKTLLYQAVYFSSPTPYASAFSGSIMISGLLLHPYDHAVYLAGQAAAFTPEEVFLLRYLAEIHPRRASLSEIARLCFPYGKRPSRSSVASRVSRINKEARRLISVPILTYRRGEGYGIDF